MEVVTESVKSVLGDQTPEAFAQSIMAGLPEVKETVQEEVAKEGDEGQEAPAEDPVTEETGNEATGGSMEAPETSVWYADEDKSTAAQYGLSEEDLKGFADRNAFRQATAIADRQTAALAKLAEKTPEPEKKPETKPEEIDLDPEAFKDFDDDTKKVVKAAKHALDELKRIEQERAKEREQFAQVQSYYQAQVQAQQEEAAQRAREEFHDTLDSHPELFGKSVDDSGKPTKLEANYDANRKRVYEAAALLHNGIIAQAQKLGVAPVIPPLKTLVQRAINMELGQELAKLDSQKRVSAAQAQSAKRRPTNAPKATKQVEPSKGKALSLDDQVNDVLANPAVQKLVNEYFT